MNRRDRNTGTVAQAIKAYPLILTMLALGGLAAGAVVGSKLAKALAPGRYTMGGSAAGS